LPGVVFALSYVIIILFSTANVPGKKDAVSGKDAKEKVRRHTENNFFAITFIGRMPLSILPFAGV